MVNEHVDLHLRPALAVGSMDVSVRVDGVLEERSRAALRRSVGQTLRRGRAVDSGQPTGLESERRGSIEIGLSGISTSSRRRHELERLLHTAVLAESEHLPDQGAEGPDVCVCAGGVPGDRIGLVAEDIRWWVNGVWTPPPSAPGEPGRDHWAIAVYLDSAPFNAARLVLSNGATSSPAVPRDSVLVGLANATDWAKEIWADNLCSGRIGSVYQEGPNGTPRRMMLARPNCREGADTIVFRKPGFFGVWHDVGHFPLELFWQAFGGTVADFTWVLD